MLHVFITLNNGVKILCECDYIVIAKKRLYLMKKNVKIGSRDNCIGNYSIYDIVDLDTFNQN